MHYIYKIYLNLIRDLQIEADFQNRGIGGECVNFANGLAEKGGLNVLGLRVFEENPACELYERLGFVETNDVAS